jgi:site-specific DNA-methyltransferase (adenine-specific)
MNQDAVKVPIGDWSSKRFKSLSENDYIRYASQNNSHLGRNVSNWLNKQTVYPHNVLVFENEHYCYPDNVLEICPVPDFKNHSACFPIELPSWFILLLSSPGDIILDPFIGIGTSALASILLERKFIGIEKMKEYVDLANRNIVNLQEELSVKKREKY